MTNAELIKAVRDGYDELTRPGQEPLNFALALAAALEAAEQRIAALEAEEVEVVCPECKNERRYPQDGDGYEPCQMCHGAGTIKARSYKP